MRQILFIGTLALIGLLAGCSDAPQEPTPGEKALQDPMNYNPAAERVNVSGGGIMDLDKKALRKDVDNALSP